MNGSPFRLARSCRYSSNICFQQVAWRLAVSVITPSRSKRMASYWSRLIRLLSDCGMNRSPLFPSTEPLVSSELVDLDLRPLIWSLRPNRGEVRSKPARPVFHRSSPKCTACPYSAESVDRRSVAARSSAPRTPEARGRAQTARYRHRPCAIWLLPGPLAHRPVPETLH